MFKIATAAMLDSDNEVFFDAIYEFIFKVVTFLPNLMKFGRINEGTTSVCLNSRWRQPPSWILGHQAFYDSIYVLSFKVLTFTPNSVKFGQN